MSLTLYKLLLKVAAIKWQRSYSHLLLIYGYEVVINWSYQRSVFFSSFFFQEG